MALKIKIIPQFIFVFCTLVLSLPVTTLKNEVFNSAAVKKARSHCPPEHHAILGEILQWRNKDNREALEWEQDEMFVPLTEWVLQHVQETIQVFRLKNQFCTP